MGGRGTGGGPGPGTGGRAKQKAGGGLSGGGSSGSGGSAGSSGGSGAGNASAGTGGVTGNGGSSSSSGGGSSTTINEQQRSKLEIEFGGDLTDAEKAVERHYLSKLPDHLREGLAARGTRVFVGGRADQSPGWARTGYNATSLTADGRELGDLSFYVPNRNEVFISARSPHGSRNVYVHELGHAIDFTWIPPEGRRVNFNGDMSTVFEISDDPHFRAMHKKYILNNTGVRKYYRTGSEGTARSGRQESVAEGMAEYHTRGRAGLVNLFNSSEAADHWIQVMTRYGVIK